MFKDLGNQDHKLDTDEGTSEHFQLEFKATNLDFPET